MNEFGETPEEERAWLHAYERRVAIRRELLGFALLVGLFGILAIAGLVYTAADANAWRLSGLVGAALFLLASGVYLGVGRRR